MSVPVANLVWEIGEDSIIPLIYKTGPEGSETPVDLSDNYSVRMDIRSNDNTQALLLTLNSADIVETPPVDTVGSSDNEITLGEDGEINIKISRFELLPDGGIYDYKVAHNLSVYAYDIFLRNEDLDTQKKILQGTITLNPSVTRWK